MNKKVWVVACLALVVAIAALIYFRGTASAAVGNLDIYNGSASITRGGAELPAQTGAEVDASDTITVAPNSEASVVFKDGSVVRLDAGSVFSISHVNYSGGKISAVILDLSTGQAWSNVEPLAPGGTFAVETPTVVATVRGTIFNVSYMGGVSQVYVNNHTVWVALRSNPSSTDAVSQGNAITIRDASSAVDFAAGPHAFTPTDKWSMLNEGEDTGTAAVPAPGAAGATTAPSTSPTPGAAKPSTQSPKTNTNANTAKTTPAVVPTSLAVTTSQSLAHVTEGDTISFAALVTFSDGSTKMVTDLASWQVVGSIGAVSQSGMFTAQLASSVEEYGQASGAIVASWKDPVSGQTVFNKTALFTVYAKVQTTAPVPGD